MRVLVVNAGSSSLKLSLLGDDDQTISSREIAAPSATFDSAELQTALRQGLAEADAVGHRIVHGGDRFRDPIRITTSVEQQLRALADLAPLHQPKSLAALDAVSTELPDLPAVACFDTAFHATLPPAATTYALPKAWRERWGVRRYGFHGLSHAYASRRTAELLGVSAGDLRVVTCHLGAGASLAAVQAGRSVDTTMGFTPLDGLVMATRCGSVDPGLLLWLLEHGVASERELASSLEHESGLLAVAGTADMREILASQTPDADLAIDVFTHHLRAGIASMAAAMNGLDAVAFTGGIGQNSSEVRSRAIDGLGFLGLSLDPAGNDHGQADRDISSSGARARTIVVVSREDLEISRQVRDVCAPLRVSRSQL